MFFRKTLRKPQPIETKTMNFTPSTLLVALALLAAGLTNPSTGDFEHYMRNEFGVLRLQEHERSNFILFSIYQINSLSFHRGEDRRTVIGVFGNFIELDQKSTW